MPTVNSITVIDCEHDAANRNKSYRKGQRNDKEAYIYVPRFIGIKNVYQ